MVSYVKYLMHALSTKIDTHTHTYTHTLEGHLPSGCVLSCSVVPHSLQPHGLYPTRLSIHGILQARILEWVAISSSRDLPNPGVEPASPVFPALADRFFVFFFFFFTTEPLRLPKIPIIWLLNFLCILTSSHLPVSLLPTGEVESVSPLHILLFCFSKKEAACGSRVEKDKTNGQDDLLSTWRPAPVLEGPCLTFFHLQL